MTLKRTLHLIQSDYRRYIASGENNWIKVLLLSQGFWASCVYRFSNYFHNEIHTPGLRQILRVVFILIQKLIEIITGISLPARAKIGRGLYIGHYGTIIVHPDTEIGNNCNLSQGVTIGVASRGNSKGVPTIGERVFVGPNASIIGEITIGDDVLIGAGAVVFESVPELAVYVGNPGKIISYRGSFEYVQFDGMELDEDRILAQQRSIGQEENSDL